MADPNIPRRGQSVTRDELAANRVAGLKHCFACNLTKPLAGFSKDKSRSDGMQPKCKACYAAYKSAKADEIATQRAGKAPTIADKHPSGRLVCDTCQVDKPLSGFQEYVVPQNTLRPTCNVCWDAHRAEWDAKDSARKRQWQLDNPDWVKSYQAEWAKLNPDKCSDKSRRYRASHLEDLKFKAHRVNRPDADKLRQQDRARYAANPSKEKAKKRAFYERNKDKESRRNAKYRAENPDIMRAQHANRRAREKSAQGSHTAGDIAVLLNLQKSCCAHSWCRKSLKKGYHVDHRMPLFLGGSNDRKNLQLLCQICNLRKNAKHPIDFAQQNGLLL